MNTLENPLFMKRVNRITDLVRHSVDVDHVVEIKFVDDEDYEHKLVFVVNNLLEFSGFYHVVSKNRKVCANEYWIIDVSSKEWRHHEIDDYGKYRNLMLDECKINIDDVLKKLDLIIVELI